MLHLLYPLTKLTRKGGPNGTLISLYSRTVPISSLHPLHISRSIISLTLTTHSYTLLIIPIMFFSHLLPSHDTAQDTPFSDMSSNRSPNKSQKKKGIMPWIQPAPFTSINNTGDDPEYWKFTPSEQLSLTSLDPDGPSTFNDSTSPQADILKAYMKRQAESRTGEFTDAEKDEMSSLYKVYHSKVEDLHIDQIKTGTVSPEFDPTYSSQQPGWLSTLQSGLTAAIVTSFVVNSCVRAFDLDGYISKYLPSSMMPSRSGDNLIPDWMPGAATALGFAAYGVYSCASNRFSTTINGGSESSG
jgi:hypothetical protein